MRILKNFLHGDACIVKMGNGQPLDGISKVVFGGQVTDEEVETLLKR